MDSASATPSRAQNQLWPIPPQMHQYLSNWEAYVLELERRTETLQNASRANEAALTTKISALRIELGALEKPLLDKISALEQSNLHLRIENESFRRELDDCIRLLTAALEVPPSRISSLIGLIQDAIIVVAEAKEQLRESL